MKDAWIFDKNLFICLFMAPSPQWMRGLFIVLTSQQLQSSYLCALDLSERNYM